ncbi:hypothetical protein HN937_21525, partial [Candidatus Poribacteria bacterium]|nr:hypothetical protein [Candidatus Poribacteria bacterium]
MTRVGEPPTALVVAGGGTLLAGGDNGVWRSRDDGRSWQTAHHGLAARKIGALVVHGGALIARSGDALHRYSPGATSWDSSTPLSPDIRVVGVGAGSLDSLAAGVYGRRVSSHGYDTWAGQFVRQERDLPPVSGAEAFVELRGTLLMATARAVHRLSDDGSSWETLAREVSGPLAVIDDSLFVGDSDGVHRSDDGGFTWRRAVWGLTNRRVSCLAGVGRTLWAGTGAVHQGPRAGIYRSDDLGESWALTTANPWGPDQGPDEVEAFAESDGSVWAYAEGAIWRYGGPHGKWQQLDGGPFDKGIATYRGVLHAVAEGRLLRLDPATLTWEPASSGAPEPLVARASAMWATRDRIYVGTEGQGVQVSTDGGASWAHAGLPKRSVSVLYEYGGVIYAGSPPRGGAQRLRPGAGAWQRLNRGDGRGRQSTSSVVTLGERLYALDRHGLSASGDNGRTWEPVAGPATNVVATRSAYGRIYEATRGDGVHVMEQVGRRWRHSGPVETRVAAQWVTAVGGVVYAGGSDGGVYVDADALRQARHSVGRLRLPRGRVLSAHDGAVVFSAPGGLIRSIDGGFTGARLQKPAATINGGAPRLDSMYVATGDRGVLRYHEGEWTPVNEGLPTLDVRGFARAGSRLYAAAHGAGVFRARERMVGDLLTTTRRRPGRPVHVTLRWEPVGDNAALREVTAIAASETMLYVGIAGGDILASANGGVSWRLTGSLHDGMDPRGMATSGKEWYVATDAGVFKLTAAGQWEGVPLTPPFIHAAAVGDGVAYVLTDSTVYRASAPDGSWERPR